MNPFRYGKPVSGEHFCDRRQELERLLANIRSSNSLWLYSPRRYGKTSLIREAFHLVSGEVETAFVDLYGVNDVDDFATSFLRGISPLVARLLGGGRKALTWFRGIFTAVSPQLTLDDSGQPVFSLAMRVPPREQTRTI